jgi:predicted DNA-binding ribbon-helix-helix protein
MKSSITKHSIVISGHKTSVTLEAEFWKSVHEIAETRGESLSQLITSIDEDRQFANLSSSIRLFVLRFYRDQSDQRSRRVVEMPAETRNGM